MCHSSHRTGPADHRRKTQAQDPEVKEERPIVDVFQIELDPPIEGQSAPTADLPEASNAGVDAEPPHECGLVKAAHVSNRQRTRAYQGHLSPQHVYELRKFVDG